jgi:hypothetical protein
MVVLSAFLRLVRHYCTQAPGERSEATDKVTHSFDRPENSMPRAFADLVTPMNYTSTLDPRRARSCSMLVPFIHALPHNDVLLDLEVRHISFHGIRFHKTIGAGSICPAPWTTVLTSSKPFSLSRRNYRPSTCRGTLQNSGPKRRTSFGTCRESAADRRVVQPTGQGC